MNEIYRLFHLYEGDKFQEPSWVHTGDFDSQADAEARVPEMRRLGWKKFRLVKLTTEEVEITA